MVKAFIPSILLIFFCLSCEKKAPLAQQKKDFLTLCFKYNPITADPRKNSDPLSCNFINMLFDGLVHLEPDGTCSLSLAESIKISKKKTRYTFRLKKAYWSDGRLITAKDFESSWKKILEPDFNSPNAYFLYPIKNAKAAKQGLTSLDNVGIKALDDHVLSIKLEEPNPHFLMMLAFTTYFPVFEKTADLSNKEWAEKGVFSGAFKIKEWKNDSYIVLEKNPYFWNASQVELKKIHILIVPDENTAFKLKEAKEIDWIGSFFSPIPQDALSSLDPNSLLFSNYAGTSGCFFNIHTFPFDNLNIRKAFAYAIDREEIVRYICLSPDSKAYALIPPSLKGSSATKLIPEGSKELALHYFHKGLNELGICEKEFPKLVFTYFQTCHEKTIACSLQQMWKKNLGISVTLEQLEVKIFLDKLFKRNFQFCLMSIIAQYYDQMNFLERFIDADGVKNYCGWENFSFKRHLHLSSKEQKEGKRTYYLEKAEKTLLQEMPIIPLFHHTFNYLKNPEIDNIEISPTGTVDFRYVRITQ